MFSVPAISGGALPLTITNSVRLFTNRYFVRSTWGTSTDTKKFTFSAWVKKASFGSTMALFSGYDGSSTQSAGIRFTASDQLTYAAGGAAVNDVTSTDVFRDDTGHYHVVVAVDTTQATAADRVKMWVNGRQLTSFSATNYPALNATHQFVRNGSTNNKIGCHYDATTYFLNGYLSEVHFLDGTAKTAADFGQFNTYGQWEPIAYSGGSYGTNGFYLDFADGSAATAAALGDDASGNTNDWTPTNISVTAGITNDFLQDTPTTNYPIFTTLTPNSGTASTPGSAGMANTTGNTGGAGACATHALPKSGKWYFEFTLSATSAANEAACGLVGRTGIESTSGFPYVLGVDGLGYYRTGQKFTYSSAAAYGNTYAVNDIIGVAVDVGADKVWFSKNGTWQNSGDPPNGTNPAFSGQGVNSATADFFPAVSDAASGDTATWHINCGQRAFNTTPPSGFSALCASSFPVPTITKPNQHFVAQKRSGTGAAASISGLLFAPDLVWVKSLNNTRRHILVDRVRGANIQLSSDVRDAEVSDSFGITAWNSDGVTLGTDGNNRGINMAADIYLDMLWKCNGAGVSNSDGTQTCTVSANATAGVSIVSYTGTGSSFTLGHGLGRVPKLIIVKDRATGATAWMVYHANSNATPKDYFFALDDNSAATFDANSWGDPTAAPTSSVFSIGTDTFVNVNTRTYIAYVFAEVPGFSRFGQFSGTGDANGRVVHTDFRPEVVIIKMIGAGAGSWQIFADDHSDRNEVTESVRADTDVAAATNGSIDFLTTGFKLRNNNGNTNSGSYSYVYAAWARTPGIYSNPR